jgi:acyl-CoA thioester hydrolase
MVIEKNLPKEIESKTVIRFQDCDPFGHLNNARYIDYFMNARQDHIASAYGIQIFDPTLHDNASWVVSKSQIAYLFPAALMEEVVIRTRLIHFSEHEIVVEGLMLDKEGKRLKAVCWVEFTYISLASGRPAKHPDRFMELFGDVQIEGTYSADGFNQRVGEVRGEVRRMRETVKEPALEVTA